jgi:hypothetical protein
MAVRKWVQIEELNDYDRNVREVERVLSVKFPSDFLECIKTNNAGCPIPNCILINNNEEVFKHLLSFNLDSDFSILKIYNMLKERLADKIIPFARDPFGNYFCFDYRKSENPSIVFWESEEASVNINADLKKVCNSFTKLLGLFEEHSEDEW